MEFIAVKTENNEEIIHKSGNVNEVIDAAENSGHDYILKYETPENQTFIF